MIGFAGCVISGLFLNLFSMVRLTELMLGNPKPFAVCFTLGNMLSMGSMLFLVGPRSVTVSVCVCVCVCMRVCVYVCVFARAVAKVHVRKQERGRTGEWPLAPASACARAGS
jgi:hypothetical protein